MIRRLLTLALVSCCGVAARPAAATPPERLRLSSNSSCPSASDVARQLSPLLQHTVVEAHQLDAGNQLEEPHDSASAVIRDGGEELEVTVGSEVRVFRDATRACAERARSSAVFIGLVLDPPILPEVVASAPPPPAAAPPKPATRRAPPSQAYLTLELGPLLQAAPGADTTQLPLAGGFGSRLAWGRTWGVALGAAFLLPTRLQLPAADARLVWLPFDVALRLSHRDGALTYSAELGPEAALLFASGDRVRNPRTSTRLELGVRGALSASWSMSPHVGAFVTLFSVWRPRPYDFRVNPGVASGTTPPWWIGSALGLALRTR